MILTLLGLGAAGWLAGESIRRGRRLGQRGTPPPPAPPQLIECFKLIAEADETQKAVFENADRRRKAIQRIDEIDRYFTTKPGITTGPEFEEFRRMAEEKRSLIEEAETLRNVMDALERGWRDLWRQYHEKCAPRPAPMGILVPGRVQAGFAYGPAEAAPTQARGRPPVGVPASFIQTGMPRPGTVGPAVSVASETGLIPTPRVPPRGAVNIPFGDVTGPMAMPTLGGVAGWLAGRSLGQRGMPIPPPQPFTEAPDWPQIPTFLGILIYKLNQARADLTRYQTQLEEAERRFDALDEANAPTEALRQAGAEAQDLAARVEDAARRIDEYEGHLEDLGAATEEPPAPPPVYRGVPIPPALPPPPLPWPKSLPEERRPIVSAPFGPISASLVQQGMPRAPTTGAAVSVAAEGAQMPAPMAPAGRTVSVPFAPVGGGMAFPGALT